MSLLVAPVQRIGEYEEFIKNLVPITESCSSFVYFIKFVSFMFIYCFI